MTPFGRLQLLSLVIQSPQPLVLAQQAPIKKITTRAVRLRVTGLGYVLRSGSWPACQILGFWPPLVL